MNAPLLSNISLITEILITISIFYIFYKGYFQGKFPTKLAVVTILYELIFNISYMAGRTPHVATNKTSAASPLAIFHGVLSLIMFVCLILFLIIAWSRYKKEENFFRKHTILTIVFLILWSASVLSGITFYVMKYILQI